MSGLLTGFSEYRWQKTTFHRIQDEVLSQHYE
jgi:hypothetical protein